MRISRQTDVEHLAYLERRYGPLDWGGGALRHSSQPPHRSLLHPQLPCGATHQTTL